MFVQCGWQELAFIRNTGAAMGAGFGLLQMVLWAFYRQPWTLPAFGAVVGALTNYLAMLAIFRPHRPIPLCPIWCCARWSRWCRRWRRCCARCCGAAPESDWEVEAPRPDRRPARRPPCCALQGLFIRHQAN